ncbi:Bifunctional 3'-5' exonuclease/ATP-dependent helicase WRN [Acropora cervicornis]|uniref:Bifunctional 3'-5' exonuclease/ATP-dependent helicase WRN n=1 Tax=Acropora cervicornis TaxID=6130 RepID=A0AAD9QMJ1_ACRCE|nr:Bifunctional 3'-5' exonuclease/ATP-dependent helicase WRN [Acropora cervicornis]
MESSQNEEVHGRISRVLDALLEISEAQVVLQNNIANDDRTRVDFLLCSIESCTSELQELIVGRDENVSKDSGNTSLTEDSRETSDELNMKSYICDETKDLIDLSDEELDDVMAEVDIEELCNQSQVESEILEDSKISQTQETTDVKPDSEHIEVLKKYFGHAKFRPMQWKIINEVLNHKQDICVVMATGYGKSLCYQFPSLYTGGTTAVISPLISLMEDQVAKLK